MDKKTENRNMEAYLKEARSWETDRIQSIEKSSKFAWRVATGACVAATAMALSIAMLVPLHKTEPYVIRVDNSTGIVDVAQGMKDEKTNYDEAINKYFTQWYIRYREGYSSELAQDYYRYVGMLSTVQEQKKYFASFNPKNPSSPLNVYGKLATVKVRVKSVSFIQPEIALVRYVKDVYRENTDVPESTHWAATITFKYLDAPLNENERSINPLGFQVVEYRNDPDSQTKDLTTVNPMQPTAAAPNTSGVTVFANSNVPQAPVVPAVQP